MLQMDDAAAIERLHQHGDWKMHRTIWNQAPPRDPDSADEDKVKT